MSLHPVLTLYGVVVVAVVALSRRHPLPVHPHLLLLQELFVQWVGLLEADILLLVFHPRVETMAILLLVGTTAIQDSVVFDLHQQVGLFVGMALVTPEKVV